MFQQGSADYAAGTDDGNFQIFHLPSTPDKLVLLFGS
jgi:hypothetical protein